MKRKLTAFDWGIYGFLALFALATTYPFLNVLAVSVSPYGDYLANPVMIFPKNITFDMYKVVFSNPLVLSSYRNTIWITIWGTALSMALTILMAYPLANKHFYAKSLFTYMMIFTMLFNGGLIPNFHLIRTLGLYNSLWALILPGAMSTYNVILLSNYIRSLPEELEEAAHIDGASDLYILFKVVLPLSVPILATLSLFYAVGKWNSYFNAIVYIRDREKWTLQLLLREVVISANMMRQEGVIDPFAQSSVPNQNVKYATIVVAILPILFVYPFLQKYFIKGILVGAVKG